MSRSTLVALFLATGLPAGGQPTVPRTDLPVTAVSLFSSGVGYFQHGGTVQANATTELRFKTAQINDILKSLVLQDLDGGRVGAIKYPSQDPVSKTLRSFQVDITANPSLAELLNQLRGAAVTVTAQAERVSGTILGVEFRPRAVERGEPVSDPILNVLGNGLIRSIDLGAVSSLSLDDPQLQEELTRALSALTQARDQDRKPVTIDFTGSGERRVRVGYVVETPVWKTSYRLLLDDRSARLQGWAIVENQTESDWNDVSLSLVSGRPISFTMDLYRPLYSSRPNVVPELFAGLRPQMYEGGIASERDRVPFPPGAQIQDFTGRGVAGGTARGVIGGTPISDKGEESLGERGVLNADAGGGRESVAAASGGKLGELFQYAVGNVTLPRQQSAMLPIVTDSVGIERVSIYNAAVLPANPLSGVILRNITDKHLLQGPVTVLDKGSYAGDARIDDVPPGQERLISFGIDLELAVSSRENARTSAVVTGKIDRGVLFVERRLVASQEYLVDNRSSREKMLVVEHPRKQGWSIVDTPRPMETTPALYRFKGAAAAGKVTTLTVKEEIVTTEQVVILSADAEMLLLHSRMGEIPRGVRDALARAVRLKQAVVDADREVTGRATLIAEIGREQQRIRENMKTVASSTEYYNRLLAKLSEQELTIERLQRERDSSLATRGDARKELEDYLSSLSIG